MVLETYPLDNVDYSAEDAELFHCTRSSGIYANDDFDYSVTGADNTITIGVGLGWIRNSKFSGKVVALKAAMTLDMGLPDAVYPRIDAVVIQFDANKNGTEIVVKRGVAASAPAAPAISKTESLYELHLYHVRREPGASAVSVSNITDLRLDPNYCGLMADSVTQIDTAAISAQVNALIESLRQEIQSVKDGSAYLLRSGGEMSGPINMNGQAIKGLNAPTADDEAVNLGFVKNMGKAKAGFIYPLASAVVPEGFLLCDGAAYARSEYPELFAAIGTMYGSGDGSTTFNVPDLRNRVPAGASENHPAGEMVGKEASEITLEEMPEHSHTVRTFGNTFTANTGTQVDAAWYSSTTNYNTGEAGGGKPRSNMQPTTYIHGYIIATGKGTGVSVADIIMGAQAIPLGLEYGGVGATDPKTARENLKITPENIGALSMKLLWENASDISALPAQTIPLDLAEYWGVMIEFMAANHAGQFCRRFLSAIAKVGTDFVITSFGELGVYLVLRNGTVNTNGVTFETAYYFASTGGAGGNGVASDSINVPIRIYGIKGVK